MKYPRISVLVADDSTVTRNAVARLIEAQPDMELADVASNGHEAVRRVLELQPDIILMDLHMPDMDGIQATWLVSNKALHGSVIMLTSEERPEYVQRAMTAGAQAYVMKPFGDGEKLLDTIREVRYRAGTVAIEVLPTGADVPLVRDSRNIVIFGSRDGIGKTSLAVNLSLALHRATGSPLVIFDADFHFGDVNMHLDLPIQRTFVDLLPRIDSLDSMMLSAVVTKHESGIHVLARPPRPELAEAITDSHVRSAVTVLSSMYDYVVTDTHASYDERMLVTFDMADIFVVVLNPNLGTLRNTRQFLDLAEKLGYSEERMCFVLSRANSMSGLTMDDFTSSLGKRQWFSIPSVGAALSTSINNGVPLVLSQPRSPYSRAVTAIADHVRVLAGQTARQRF